MSGRVDFYPSSLAWPPSGWDRTIPHTGQGVEAGKIQGGGSTSSAKEAGEVAQPHKCQTCAKRKYQDRSDDPGVSFQAPTHISPEAAPSAVAAHEREHVTRNQAEAEREGREVVHQSVQIHTAICPECGRVYVSGGTTTTVTRPKTEPSTPTNLEDPGQILNLLA